jgi:Zn-dependent peptidase ImmA (M78 family)
MKLGGKPGCTLRKTLEENYGVKIFHEELGKHGSALCARDDFGFAVLLNASEPRWRRNYSLAHELFHLMTSTDWDSHQCEVLADAFASALLLPEESLMSSLRSRAKGKRISLQDLVEIACEFDVSIDALCWRLVNLEKLKKQQVRQQLLEGSRLRALDRFSRRDQHEEIKAGLPERYTRLCYTAYSKGKIGRSKLAEYLEVSLFDLVKELNTNSETLASAETEIAVVGC